MHSRRMCSCQAAGYFRILISVDIMQFVTEGLYCLCKILSRRRESTVTLKTSSIAVFLSEMSFYLKICVLSTSFRLKLFSLWSSYSESACTLAPMLLKPWVVQFICNSRVEPAVTIPMMWCMLCTFLLVFAGCTVHTQDVYIMYTFHYVRPL